MYDELYSKREQLKLESCVNTNQESTGECNKEINMVFISIPTYQAHIIDPMLFCIEIGVPISCTGEKALERIDYPIGHWSIPTSQYDRKLNL